MPKYKGGKQTKTVEFEEMEWILGNSKLFKHHRHQSYLAFLYLTGVRRSEALERVREDFTKDPSFLTVKIPAKKHGSRDILKLLLDMPFMDMILEDVESTKPGRRVWSFTGRTALNVVKRAMGEKYYPHFLRLNRSVHFLDDPTTTLPEMQAWFGWRRIDTINSYMGYSTRHIDRQAERLKQNI